MTINLREEFEDIMDDHGHWGVIRRRVSIRKTENFDPSTHESDSPQDLASGEAFYDEFVRMRKMTFFSAPEDPTPYGRASVPMIIFWVQHPVKPSRGDFLLEIAQDGDSANCEGQIQPVTPYEIVRKYDIVDVDDMREAGGRIEYWRVVCEEADLGDES